MDKEKIEIAIKEMKELYDCGKYKELSKIEFDENETKERRLAAHTISQLGFDPRRLIWYGNR